MPSVLPPSRDLAHWLLSRESQHTRPEELATVAEAVCTKLDESLSRSIGRAGYRALFARAVSTAREQHTCLVAIKAGDAGRWLHGVDESISKHGHDAVADGVIEVFAQIVELLNRFVGGLLALRLLQAAWPDLMSEAN